MPQPLTSFDYAILTQYLTISPLRDLAIRIGCHEAALRLIFSLLLAYPIGIIYNLFFIRCSVQQKHLFFLTCGFTIGIFNYGINILHTLTTVITMHSVMKILDGNATSVIITFTFCSAYLLWGYYVTFSEEYAFEWTIPQCVLTLRLIAVSFDVYDGRKDRKKVVTTESHKSDNSPVNPNRADGNHVTKSPPAAASHSSTSSSAASNPHTTALQSQSSSSAAAGKKSGGRGKGEDESGNPEAMSVIPSLLQVLAHSYFPASFLVGPQFGLQIYLDFVKEENGFLSKSLRAGIDRLLLGILYMVTYQIGSLVFPHTYLVTPDFRDQPFLWKIVLMTVITKIQLCKYICIWLISEGSCVVSGVTYDREKDSFDKCSNVLVYEYETTSTFGGLIRSFNVTTNHWSGKYIFKRLKFLRSKFLSHLCTLIYLALWHGWKSGYYVTFTIELLIMKTEWEVMNVIKLMRVRYSSLDQFLSAFYVYWPIRIAFRIYTLVVFGYCLIPFILLSYSKWIDVLAQFYFLAHLIYIPYNLIFSPLILPIVTRLLTRDGKKKE